MSVWLLISEYLDLADVFKLTVICKSIRDTFLDPTGGYHIPILGNSVVLYPNRIALIHDYIWVFEKFVPLSDDYGGLFTKVFVCKNCDVCLCPVGEWDHNQFTLYRNDRHTTEWIEFDDLYNSKAIIWYTPWPRLSRKTIQHLLNLIIF